MTEKQKITITVSGQPGTGKSTVMALIANQLEGFDINVTQQPLPGETVVTGPLRDRLRRIASRLEVVIVKEQMTRGVRATSLTSGGGD